MKLLLILSLVMLLTLSLVSAGYNDTGTTAAVLLANDDTEPQPTNNRILVLGLAALAVIIYLKEGK